VHTVSQEDNYLTVDLTYCKDLTPSQLNELLPLKSHIIRLKATGCPLADELIPIVSQMDNLTTLFLDHSNISDAHLSPLNVLKRLKFINLAYTSVTNAGLKQLKIPSLQKVYLYGSKIDKNSLSTIYDQFPAVYLDTGDYVVPILESDTTEAVGQGK
jgi:Leucine-rich repeat (LRR) protein